MATKERAMPTARATRATPRAAARLGHTASITIAEQSAEIRHLRNQLAEARFFIAREAELREGRGANADHLRKFLAS